MAHRDYYSIIFLLISTFNLSFSQETEVRCINPTFDKLVDSYLTYSVPAISVADAYESKEKYIFLDAREMDEYKTSHIPNAVHVGYDNFDIKKVNKQLSKDTPIIVYCSIGYRSEKIGEILKKNGYSSVLNLYGSIFEWVNQHHTIVDPYDKITKSLHTYNKKWSKWVEEGDIKKTW